MMRVNTRYKPQRLISLFLELNARDPNNTGITPTSNFSMSIWKDRSQYSHDVGQATPTAQPLYDYNSGDPQVEFNGTAQYLSAAYNAAFNPTDVTIYCLCAATGGAGSFRTPVCSRYFDGTNFFGYTLLAANGDTWNLQVGNGGGAVTIIGKPIVLGQLVLLRAILRTTTNPLVVNGTGYPGTSAAYSVNPIKPLYVGAIENATLFFNGWIKHVLLFSTAHSVSEQNQNVNYLQGIWAGVS